ncbi:DUF551 domain-containing protein [Citrobacter braakii]|uniref:DUF551 domain-containing protein n=1 Tax=Citrobacter braakii TaxID=57706 RepID=UPI00193DC85E|nr:DUF551 domain-containing protein [Citrobacter braakii]MBM3061486.1 DUF551 domain-containing protein [Citrobacter braakii]MBM3068982.1 DUF551 domain-containing protein [Citrobacter braakii]
MTTNHPAHGPVSLDRLHQIREVLSKASAQSDGGNLGYAMADAVKVIDEVLNAEPVLYAAEETLAYAKMGELHLKCLSQPMGDAVIPLYTTPPAQVVPENCVTAEHRRVIEMLLNVCGAAFELADDSCQQDVDGEECHVVPDDAFQKLSDALDEIENTLPTEDVDRPDVFLAWSAMPRAALKSILQAGNSPVTPDGWIPVSDRMPEAHEPIYIFHPDYGVDEGVWYDNQEDAFLWDSDRSRCRTIETVSHWMPMPSLPAAPQQEVK